MSAVLFVMPLKKDKTDSYKAFLNECLGPKKNDYADLLRRYDLNTIQMWISTLNGRDYAIFTHEMGDDAAQRLESWASSTHPFDQWFDKNLRDCYDVENVAKMPTPPEFLGELDTRKIN